MGYDFAKTVVPHEKLNDFFGKGEITERVNFLYLYGNERYEIFDDESEKTPLKLVIDIPHPIPSPNC